MRKLTAMPIPMPAFAPDDRPAEATLVLVDGSNALFVFVVRDEKALDTTALVVMVDTVKVVKADTSVYVSLVMYVKGGPTRTTVDVPTVDPAEVV